jgi:3-hydroxyisobutyrate dehydrogenase
MNTTINARPYDSTPARRVAFLGLGVMGYPMAGHLALAGHEVTVYNRTATKSEAFCAQLAGAGKVNHAETPAAAAAGAEIVLACVGNDDDLRQVVLGEAGAFAGMAPGAIFVDHTTASANVARELDAVARSRGLHFIDAPVSGGQAGAAERPADGDVRRRGGGRIRAACKPVAMAFSRAFTLMGPSGAGQLTKMVNQICIAGLVQGLAEAIAFGQRAGLDVNQVLEVIGKGAAQSWQLDNRGKTMVAGQIRLRLRRGLDAQGPGPGARRSQAQRRASARHRPGRSVLRRRAANGRRALGHVQPHQKVEVTPVLSRSRT